MTDPATTEAAAPATASELSARILDEVAHLDAELGEVELLITQARLEATRHEARRAAASEKLTSATAAAAARGELPLDGPELGAQLVLLTKRAALMESQVEVLEGKQRALARFRDALAGYAEAFAVAPDEPPATDGDRSIARGRKDPAGTASADPIGSLPPAVSRLLLGAQEDMRREIARAMHDGPAQSLTNIVLQAQIVERLVAQDPARASAEVHQLVAMVQQTLEATKTFIFDVRPMVLDDLGLVPTLRRVARERGRRAGVPVEFESMGQDRRMSVDLESGLFRIFDQAIAAYLEAKAERVTLKIDWSADRLEGTLSATRSVVAPKGDVLPSGATGKDVPPALAAMMEERRMDAQTAAEQARRAAVVSLPASVWREVRGRAATLPVTVDLSEDGAQLHLVVDFPQEAAEAGAVAGG